MMTGDQLDSALAELSMDGRAPRAISVSRRGLCALDVTRRHFHASEQL